MSEAVSYSVRDGIAVITMNNLPVNGLGSKLRPGIMESIKKAEADPAVKAAVIWGSPKVFSGGAEIGGAAFASRDQRGAGRDEEAARRGDRRIRDGRRPGARARLPLPRRRAE